MRAFEQSGFFKGRIHGGGGREFRGEYLPIRVRTI
jgi:hypothetical protein